jgi:hypothetical protein
MNDESKAIGYEHLIVRLGSDELDKNDIRELRIERKVNDHVRVFINGIVGGGQKEQYLEMTEAATRLMVECVKPQGKVRLFSGVVTRIAVNTAGDVYHFEVDGASDTYLLDVKRRDRSFQDLNLEYRQLIETVIAASGALCNKPAVKDEKLENFILQYHETDWEFLKRIASRKPFTTGLVADTTGNKAQFWFGIPEGKEHSFNKQGPCYTVTKKIAVYRDAAANHLPEAREAGFIDYRMPTDEFFNIGDRVKFNGQKLAVDQAVATMSGGILRFECSLIPEAGLKQNPLYHPELTGVSIEGRVIAVEQDQLKVSLVGIGERTQAKERACFFPYATAYTAEGNTGWYCMPEIDDFVRLYFPTPKEEDAFVTTAVRSRKKADNGKESSPQPSGDKLDNPQIKYFRTKFGKEIMFSEDEILITGKDGELLVRLNEAKGIEILSSQAVALTAKKDITITAEEGKVAISAGDEIDLVCKAGSIKMDGETHIKGSQVKIN